MTAYYNEIDPFTAQWLRNLIKAGHIAPGIVDERSIEDVTPADLAGFTQCHFFAGIGGWSAALRRAGWDDSRRVWTASCPCQPFSTTGAEAGFTDERHLWPSLDWLIGQCRPSILFGEQVASKGADPWVDLVQTDLEALDYAFGAIAFPSAGIGAPHVRDRVYFAAERMAHPSGKRWGEERPNPRRIDEGDSAQGRSTGFMPSGANNYRAHNLQSFWKDAVFASCEDGRRRPIEPGSFPLANGISQRVGRLRAYGNAVNVDAARHFIQCYEGTLFDGN